MRWSYSLCSMTLAAALAVGQQPTTRTEAPRPADNSASAGMASADVHTESRSRELFTACDGDSDDRLDLFEACEALETLGDPKDSTAFQRLDKDRDGYLTWPEFDQHFRAIVQRGGTFRVRTCRHLVPQAPEQQQVAPATPLQRFIQLYDKNGNGGLDPDEIDQVVRLLGLPPAVGTSIKALDLDQSGRVEETELAPFFERLGGAIPLPGFGPIKPAATLPPAWAPLDANGDGAIDVDELAQALRRIDPAMARWAALLMQRLDRSKSGKLEDEELPGGNVDPQQRKTTAAKS